MLSDKNSGSLAQADAATSGVHLRLPSFVMFVVYSVIVSSFFSRIHDLKAGLVLDEKDMGILLLSLPAGVVTGSLFISRIVDRFSAKNVVLMGMPVFSAFPLLAISAGSMQLAFVILFLYGLFSSIMNIAINVEAHRVEGLYKFSLLNKCHGSFSIGFLIFSFIAAYIVGLGVSAAEQHWMVFFGVSGVMLLLYFRYVSFREEASIQSDDSQNSEKPRVALPTLPILCVLLYGLFGFTMEGISRSWGVIYVEDLFNVDTALAAYALPFLIVGSSLGRFLADRMIASLGTVSLSKWLTAVTVIGIGFLTLSSNYVLALIGITLIGFGVSTVHPQSIRTVASLKGKTPAYNIAAFSTIQTMVMYVGPSLFGVLAHYVGFRIAILFFVSLAAVAYSATRYLKE
ncbi:MAG: MFS transporter [Granulosicoccus sp.]